jgi:hypothetical protein
MKKLATIVSLLFLVTSATAQGPGNIFCLTPQSIIALAKNDSNFMRNCRDHYSFIGQPWWLRINNSADTNAICTAIFNGSFGPTTIASPTPDQTPVSTTIPSNLGEYDCYYQATTSRQASSGFYLSINTAALFVPAQRDKWITWPDPASPRSNYGCISTNPQDCGANSH